jgi:hypothetical protein
MPEGGFSCFMLEDHHCDDRTKYPKKERCSQKRFFRYPEEAQFGEQFIDAINQEGQYLEYRNQNN